MQNESEKKQSVAWAIVAVLAVAVAMLGFLFFQQRAELTDQEATVMEKVREVAATRTTLDSISTVLNMKIAEVEKLGGDVAELNKVKEQLEADKLALSRSTKVESRKYLAKIKEYEKFLGEKDIEIAQLQEQNMMLATTNDSLNTTVGTLRDERETLVARQTELSDSVMTYTAQNKELSDKVSRASALKAQNFKVLAVTTKGKTRDKDEYKAKRVDKIKMLFDLPENPLTREERKDIYVRVLDPEGAVLSDDAMGSGEFEINGRETKYTARETVAYQNNNQKVEMLYDNSAEFRPGKYSIELYAEGYRIGGGNFVIR